MRVFRTNRESESGVFSLDNLQLYVGEVSEKDGSRHKGLAVAGAIFGNLPKERAFVLTESDARRLIEFLDAVLSGSLTASFSIKIGFFEKARWNVRKYTEKWHGGGGFRGRFSYGGVFGAAAVPVTITKESATALRKCIVEFYAID